MQKNQAKNCWIKLNLRKALFSFWENLKNLDFTILSKFSYGATFMPYSWIFMKVVGTQQVHLLYLEVIF